MIAPNPRAAALLVACIAGLGACVLALTSGGFGHEEGRSDRPLWREIAWPFARDAWDAGRAFKCEAAQCGGGTEVYIRPKLGFCNCTAGVSDDEEVDRVTDLDLITPDFAPSGTGRAIESAGLRGRARRYDLRPPDGSARNGFGIALSRHCDVVVAMAQNRASAPIDERAVLELLASAPVRTWIEARLDGRRQAAAF
jgi:hypothetical protein